MPKHDPERTLVLLEWMILIAAVLANGLALRAHAHASVPAMSLGIAATAAYGAVGLIVSSTRIASLAITLGEIAAVTGLAVLCGRETYLFLCVVLVARAARRLPRLAALVVGGLAVALPLLPALAAQGLAPMSIGEGLLYAVIVAFVIVAVSALQHLADAHEQLRRSAAQLEKAATMAERTRIAYELHDSVGHQLAVLNIALESSIAVADDDPVCARTFLTHAKETASMALSEVRRTVSAMEGDLLLRDDLVVIIARLAEDVRRLLAIEVDCKVDDVNCSPPMKTVLYRVAQEALTNAVRHASAQRLVIVITGDGKRVMLEIRDDGRGFDPAANRSGHGLRIMRERVESLGGSFAITTSQGAGCVVRVALPVTV